jgi:hypothetical protein
MVNPEERMKNANIIVIKDAKINNRVNQSLYETKSLLLAGRISITP